MAAATGNYISVIDGDGQNPIEDLVRIYQHITEKIMTWLKPSEQTGVTAFTEELSQASLIQFSDYCFPQFDRQTLIQNQRCFLVQLMTS